MAPKTKADVISELRLLGEEPPAQWTMVELRTRLAELMPKKQSTELQLWVKALNRASKKKSELIAWMSSELGVTNMENSTMVQLQKAAMERIYQKAAAHETDPVGFGTHCQLSYIEVKVQEPEYCQWVMKTQKEGQCSYRLQRLALWLEETKDVVMRPEQPKSKKPMAAEAARSSAENQELMAVMQQMMHKMENMQDELEEVRGRHHKKSKDDEILSSPSWDVMSTNPANQ
eukprot:s2053_g10.t1